VTPDLQKLRARDPDAFAELIDACSPMMLRLARGIAGAHAAEEIVQDGWMAAFAAIDRFEGRSSVRTWLGTIVVNRARTVAKMTKRSIPLGEGDDEIDRLVDRAGHWMAAPSAWAQAPDALIHRAEVRAALEAALEQLPEEQRTVVTLRDLEGFTAEEVCHILEVSASNQRQLLHRGRLKLRRALEGILT
jgi:RNA polymerase sigma-70 factor (ECF subfamily)